VLAGRTAINGDDPAGADLLRALRERPAQVALPLSGEITFVALNTRVKPFDEPNVRRAVSAALDQDAVLAAPGGRVVGDVPTHWIPPGVPGFEEAGGKAGPGVDFLAFRQGNLALARRYLRQAGYTRGRIAGVPVLDLVARRQPSAPAFAAETGRALAALGLRSRVRFLAFGPFIRACSRDPSVAACLGYRWQRDLDDAASMLPPLFGRPGLEAGTNVSRLSDPSLESLMDEAATTTGEADRAERWADVDRRVTELAPGADRLEPRGERALGGRQGRAGSRAGDLRPQLHVAARAMRDAPPTGTPLRFVVSLLARQRRMVPAVLVLNLGIIATTLVTPLLTGYAVERIDAGDLTGADGAVGAALAIALVGLLGATFSAAAGVVSSQIAAVIETDLRSRLYRHNSCSPAARATTSPGPSPVRARRTWQPPLRPSTRSMCSSASPTASTPRSASAASDYPAASASSCRSPAR
jgi:Bacterial extracellular solute-binding proteins, family 5 Middle